METTGGIPNKYLSAACLILAFILFVAGGMAFAQSIFYGMAFDIIGAVLFFTGVHFRRQDPGMYE
jgi:hypothetical protein